MEEPKYDFRIIFDKMDEAEKDDNQILVENIKISSSVNEEIKQLKEIFDTNETQQYEILTRS